MELELEPDTLEPDELEVEELPEEESVDACELVSPDPVKLPWVED